MKGIINILYANYKTLIRDIDVLSKIIVKSSKQDVRRAFGGICKTAVLVLSLGCCAIRATVRKTQRLSQNASLFAHEPQGLFTHPIPIKKPAQRTGFFLLVAGAGFEPLDLQVMSLTSYQTALPRDNVCNITHSQ